MRVRHPAGVESADPLLERAIGDAIALGHELVPGEDPLTGGLDALHRHDPLEVRHLISSLEHLVQLRLALHEDHRCLGVVGYVLHLFGRAGRVDPCRGTSDRHRRQVEDHPLRPVEAEDRDDLPRLTAEGNEGFAGSSDLVGVLRPGGGPIGAVALAVIRRGCRHPLRIAE